MTTKNEIKKTIQEYLKLNYEGKEFFNTSFQTICLNKLIGADINFNQIKLDSGIFNYSNTEFQLKLNFFYKESLNIEILLRNSDFSFNAIINLQINDFKNANKAMIEQEIEKHCEKVFNKEYNINYVNEVNNEFKKTALYLINDKIKYVNLCKNEENKLETLQSEFLIKYYNSIIQEYLI